MLLLPVSFSSRDGDCTVRQVVVNALVQAIPSIFNVLLVCLVFWLVFGIMGVTLFSGRFYSCVDSEQNLVDVELVPDRQKCFELAHLNYSWTNPIVNFDSVPAAYLSLFQVVKHVELAFFLFFFKFNFSLQFLRVILMLSSRLLLAFFLVFTETISRICCNA